jgi:hypothetical protein
MTTSEKIHAGLVTRLQDMATATVDQVVQDFEDDLDTDPSPTPELENEDGYDEHDPNNGPDISSKTLWSILTRSAELTHRKLS